eukprot:TRINITY_DN9055_c0_g1_i1.p1 TRINITY_DN9055_c0_g1~~TRINITY_DN9055_c0_g1_i1.p1  ORF type:complete len:254 (+),score=28.25 TRINITY_DN9055_c0_g1_i1:96-857(+)
MSTEVSKSYAISPETLLLFPSLTPEQVLTRAEKTRTKALEVCDYRCIREWRFLETRINTNPIYPKVLPNLQNKTILDLGCCFGTDIRRLLYDGAKAQNIVGVDQYSQFLEFGFELFGDKELLQNRFIVSDFLVDNLAKRLTENNFPISFDVIYASSILHLLTDEECKQFLKLAFSLLNPGGIFFGQSVGASTPVLVNRERKSNSLGYLQSPQSLTVLMEQSGFSDIMIHWKDRQDRDERQGWGFISFSASKKS